MKSDAFVMPKPAPPPARRVRLRQRRDALAWKVKDALDRFLVPSAVERLRIRLGARARNARQASAGPIRRLYVDISVIAKNDAGTGIQRVVRSVYARLAELCDDDTAILPVVVNRRREGYRTLSGEPLRGGDDAVFFGLDFSTDSVFRYRHELAKFREDGGRLWFVLHDILPLSHPDWFTPVSGLKYRRWLRTLARIADGLLCVSPVVAGELTGLLRARYGLAVLPHVATVPLGSSIAEARRTTDQALPPPPPGMSRELLAQAALVVGTLEPRKGHVEVLDAFDRLWSCGSRIPLVLVGKAGWNTLDLQKRIREHPQAGSRLFWYDDLDDLALHAAYVGCRMVINPSLAEGYGLPLDEALFLGAPVLARDIPVFRRHPGAALAYFPERVETAQLAQAIADFHAEAPGLARAPVSLASWTETATACLREIGCARAIPGQDTRRGSPSGGA